MTTENQPGVAIPINLRRIAIKPPVTDKNAINHSIEICNIGHLVNRNIHTLSGGEITLVHCARAFSTESPLLLADEIVSSLDPFHEIKIMNVIKNFVRINFHFQDSTLN